MKITKLYVDSSLDFKLWGWKRVDEYPTSSGISDGEVIGKYILAEGCEYIFGNVAAYAVSFNYTTVPEYDVVFLLGNPATNYKLSHPIYEYMEVTICDISGEVMHVACDWLDIPVITLNIFFEESRRLKPLPSRDIFTSIDGANAPKILDPIVKYLNLNQNSKILVYLTNPIFTSTSREGRAVKRILKFLKNYEH